MHSNTFIKKGLEKPIENNLGRTNLNPNVADLCYALNGSLKPNILKNNFSLRASSSTLTVDDLILIYTYICELGKKNSLLDSQKLLLEDHKESIMLTIQEHLQLLTEDNETIEIKTKNKSKLSKYLKLGAFGFLLISGLFLDGMGNFLGGQSLLALIPGISNPLLLGLAFGITAVNAMVFLGFEATLLKNALGISSLKKSAKTLLNTYDRQIETTKKINDLLTHFNVVSKLNNNKYNKYAHITTLFNQDLQTKHDKFESYKEKPLSRVARYVVNAFTIATVAGGAYFYSSVILGLLGAGLLGTPAGWVIAGLVMATSVAYYCAMGAKSLYDFFNPTSSHFKSVKKNLNHFVTHKKKDAGFFNKIIDNKKAIYNSIKSENGLISQNTPVETQENSTMNSYEGTTPSEGRTLTTSNSAPQLSLLRSQSFLNVSTLTKEKFESTLPASAQLNRRHSVG